tara:strand:+ start:15906 stop:17063 length:1158 start_codon:yes stop_codon:yes gene_type:complete
MKQVTFRQALPIGVAMFSMFFGAGNVVFPLILGANSGSQLFYAMLGFLVMGVGIPFCGLFGILLFKGDYQAFFARLGVFPAYLTIVFLIILIGPFVGMPRIISLSFSTLHIPGLSLWQFNLIACALLFALTLSRKHIMNILGYVLSPLLIIALLTLIITGFSTHSAVQDSHQSPLILLSHGVENGYNTMDLLAAFFFAAIVYKILTLKAKHDNESNVQLTLKGSIIGAIILALVYIGFSTIAALHSAELIHADKAQMIYYTAHVILGSKASIVANSIFALACLTTAMTLGVIVSEFVQEKIFRGLVPYWGCLLGTYLITFVFANFGFINLINYCLPILKLLYPALIMLTLCNIAYKLWGFKPVKWPVAITVAIALGFLVQGILYA